MNKHPAMSPAMLKGKRYLQLVVNIIHIGGLNVLKLLSNEIFRTIHDICIFVNHDYEKMLVAQHNNKFTVYIIFPIIARRGVVVSQSLFNLHMAKDFRP